VIGRYDHLHMQHRRAFTRGCRESAHSAAFHFYHPRSGCAKDSARATLIWARQSLFSLHTVMGRIPRRRLRMPLVQFLQPFSLLLAWQRAGHVLSVMSNRSSGRELVCAHAKSTRARSRARTTCLHAVRTRQHAAPSFRPRHKSETCSPSSVAIISCCRLRNRFRGVPSSFRALEPPP
jgi:hypothetical protein